MANELSVINYVTFAKSGLPSKTLGDTTAFTITVSGSFVFENIQTVGTSEEALEKTGISALGWCYMKNLDATNFIKVRSGTGGTDMLKIKPGEAIAFRWMTGLTPYVIADTAACRLHYCIFND